MWRGLLKTTPRPNQHWSQMMLWQPWKPSHPESILPHPTREIIILKHQRQWQQRQQQQLRLRLVRRGHRQSNWGFLKCPQLTRSQEYLHKASNCPSSSLLIGSTPSWRFDDGRNTNHQKMPSFTLAIILIFSLFSFDLSCETLLIFLSDGWRWLFAAIRILYPRPNTLLYRNMFRP
jgi:hypothetical protein